MKSIVALLLVSQVMAEVPTTETTTKTIAEPEQLTEEPETTIAEPTETTEPETIGEEPTAADTSSQPAEEWM
mgnify:CR=1 FL=1